MSPYNYADLFLLSKLAKLIYLNPREVLYVTILFFYDSCIRCNVYSIVSRQRVSRWFHLSMLSFKLIYDMVHMYM